jgi:outer membrane protein assembly factor BamB
MKPARPVVLMLCAILLGGGRLEAQADWPSFLRDNARTGHNPGETTLQPPLETAWTSLDAAGVEFSATIVVGNAVFGYCGPPSPFPVMYPPFICRLNLTTGAMVWQASVLDIIGPTQVFPSRLAETEGVLYFTTNLQTDGNSGVLYALSSASGDLLWTKDFSRRIEGANPVVDGDVLYLAATWGRIYAVDRLTQAILWEWAPPDNRFHIDPIVVNEFLVYQVKPPAGAPGEEALLGFDKTTGQLLWTDPRDPGEIIYSGTVLANEAANLAYYATDVATNQFVLKALDVASGNLQWSFACTGQGNLRPALIDDRLYYYCSNAGDGALYVLNAVTGAELEVWNLSPVPVAPRHITSANDVLYINDSSVEGRARAYDASTGALVWESSEQGWVWEPIVLANGRALAPVDDADSSPLVAWENAGPTGDLPDLIPGAITFSPPPTIGQPTSARVDVTNQGTAAAGAFDVTWSLDGSVAHTERRESPLAPGSIIAFEFLFEIAGEHVVRVDVDSADEIEELVETNNASTASTGAPEPGGPSLTLSMSPDELNVNAEGWYQNNPVEITAIATCPADHPADNCQGELRLDIGSANDIARFYVFDGVNDPNCLIGYDDSDNLNSHRSYSLLCPFMVFRGQSTALVWKLWSQPSPQTSLQATASWMGSGGDDSLDVPSASVHPLVVIHGILGSMAPQNKLIDNQRDMNRVLDPFIGAYRPLLNQLQRMGYEWNTTLFALAYDWRESNVLSGGFLADELAGSVIPRSGAESHVRDDGKADLLVHSMGGLVARAYVQGRARSPATGASIAYRNDVNKVIFTATPHKGFPFDYRTWEGMTWRDYLYNAPLISGSGLLLTDLMDRILWPTLVAKRYGATAFELALTPTCQIATEPSPFPNRVIIVPVDVPIPFECDRAVVYRFAHDPAPHRGIRSLPEMLPTQDVPLPYLVRGSSDYPYGKEVNAFLTDMNSNVHELTDALGLSNIYVLYGNGAAETDIQYDVDPPPAVGWAHGRPFHLTELALGDDLIPAESASMAGVLSLPAAQIQELDAAPSTSAGGARHKEILRHTDTQRVWLARWLTDTGPLPFETAYKAPLANLPGLIAITAACPVNLLVTDPAGRRLGYDPATGQMIEEIPHSVATSPGIEPHLVLIGDPLPGDYQVQTVGYDTGPYAVRIDKGGPGGLAPVALYSGSTAPDQQDLHVVAIPENVRPAALDDAYEVDEGSVLQVHAPGVLENDIDSEGSPLTAVLVTEPSHGDVQLSADGSFSYTPHADFTGTDSFTYRAGDGELESNEATVFLTVVAVNHEPVAADDAYRVLQGEALDVGAPGVLSNDTDPDGDPLTAVVVDPTTHGAIELRPDGSFLYRPAAGFSGTDAFTYQAFDGTTSSNLAQSVIVVEPSEPLPVASDDLYFVDASGRLEVRAPGVLANDHDPNGGRLMAVIETPPAYGRLHLRPDGSFVYHRHRDVIDDTFTYRAQSAAGVSTPAVVTLRADMSCSEIYGVDTARDVLVRIGPRTGAGSPVGSLGIRVDTAGLDFDAKGRLYGFSRSEQRPQIGFLYQIDLRTGAAKVMRKFDVSRISGGMGLELGPDGKTFYLLAGRTLSILDVKRARIVPFAKLPFAGSSLTLPACCRDFLSFDLDAHRLVRISSFDGEVEVIGPPLSTPAIDALASSADGDVYAHGGGNLYEIDERTGEAIIVGEIGLDTSGLAVRPPSSERYCLDAKLDPRTGLSQHVVEINERVRHASHCDREDGDCGKCGTDGFYRMFTGGKMLVRTPPAESPGRYRIRFLVRGKGRLMVRVQNQRFMLGVADQKWRWTEPISVDLGRRAVEMFLAAIPGQGFDLDAVRIEEDCGAGCDDDSTRRMPGPEARSEDRRR